MQKLCSNTAWKLAHSGRQKQTVLAAQAVRVSSPKISTAGKKLLFASLHRPLLAETLVPARYVKVKSHNKKLLIDNNITVPTHINSLSTKSAKSYNKYWQTLPQCQKVLNLTTNIDKTCHNVIYPRKLPNLTKKSAKSYNKSAKSYNKYWQSLPQ